MADHAARILGAKDIDAASNYLESHISELRTSDNLHPLLELVKTGKRDLARRIQALECLAYCKFEHNIEAVSLEDLHIDSDLDISRWISRKQSSVHTTAAGYARQDTGPQFPNLDALNEVKPPASSFSPYILEMLIVNTNTTKPFVDKWWPAVLPALLNALDSTDLSTKARAIDLTRLLCIHHEVRLVHSGLAPVFQSSIEPCLNFLSPLVEPQRTMQIHRPAMLCLAQLSRGEPAKLNQIARDGCLKPFLYTRDLVKLKLYFLESLTLFTNQYLKSLTAVHLHGITKVFNEIMCDPFVDYSPALITAACSMMENVIRWTWPRIEKYKYTIFLGLTKANSLDSECCKLLKPSENELAQLVEAASLVSARD